MISERENYIRAATFESPEWIPCIASISPLTWRIYREALEEVVLQHPRLFPDYERPEGFWEEYPPGYRAGEYLRDNWGCLWYTAIGGLEGLVVESPLADWDALDKYQTPDTRTKDERSDMDWEGTLRDLKTRKEAGKTAIAFGGRLFDRMYFLRGFENLMVDFATDDPHLPRLIEMITEYELEWIQPYLHMGVDVLAFHTDIGTQNGLMIHPEQFRRYLKPMFSRVFQTCREAGALVYLSSDGCLLEIVDDLVECGVSIHDPQLRANTLDGIESHYKGKLCASLDLDRQMFAFATPEEIRSHVRECVDRMYMPEGGVMVGAAAYDDNTSLENISALFSAIEENCFDR